MQFPPSAVAQPADDTDGHVKCDHQTQQTPRTIPASQGIYYPSITQRNFRLAARSDNNESIPPRRVISLGEERDISFLEGARNTDNATRTFSSISAGRDFGKQPSGRRVRSTNDAQQAAPTQPSLSRTADKVHVPKSQVSFSQQPMGAFLWEPERR